MQFKRGNLVVMVFRGSTTGGDFKHIERSGLCVCVCVCVCVCLCDPVFLWVYLCKFMCVCVCIEWLVFVYICIYIYIYTCAYVCVGVGVCIDMYIRHSIWLEAGYSQVVPCLACSRVSLHAYDVPISLHTHMYSYTIGGSMTGFSSEWLIKWSKFGKMLVRVYVRGWWVSCIHMCSKLHSRNFWQKTWVFMWVGEWIWMHTYV